MTSILLDADIPIFKFASVNQTEEPSWDEGGESEIVLRDFEDVTKEIDCYIQGLLNRLKADEIIVALSEPAREKNWRRTVLATYKEKRSETVSPVYRQPLTDYLEESYPSYLKPTLEGDDVLGILATNPKIIKDDTILVSGDKDLRTIPSREKVNGTNLMFNPDKDDAPYFNPEWLADYYWMYQTLIGDSTDGYKGLDKCGPAAAIKLLDIPKPSTTIEVMWPKVVAAYAAKGFTEEDALVQAQVARICRTEDFNFKTKRAIPWTP